jgi:beta-lactamase superfamily II metal-dependent hydrolase
MTPRPAMSNKQRCRRKTARWRVGALALSLAGCATTEPAPADGSGSLHIYYIDVEGGQSTLFVGPTGESLLVDTGNPGERDLGRILETLETAGVSRIDHLWTTHYHVDHVGALLALAEQIPVGRFYDHGAPHEDDRIVSADFLAAYETLTLGRRTTVAPGDVFELAGADIVTLVSNGDVLESNLPGGGGENPACAGVSPLDESGYFDSDNGASAGFLLTYGRFRTVDLGDLTWNGELALICPENRIGAIDLYLTSHHGLRQSGSPALVHALRPRVAVMNNGVRKGGAPEAFRVLHEAPGLEDLWQLHWSHNARLENAPTMFVANIDDDAVVAELLATEPVARSGPGPAGFAPPPGGPGPGGPGPGAAGANSQGHAPAYLIHVEAHADGGFVVTNTRNGFSKSYPPESR